MEILNQILPANDALAVFLVLVVYLVGHFIVKAISGALFGSSIHWQKASGAKRHEWAYDVMAQVFYVGCNYYAYVLAYLPSEVSNDHHFGFNQNTHTACVFVLGSMAYFVSAEVLSNTVSVQMLFHHAFIVGLWTYCLYTHELTYYLLICTPFEICSFFFTLFLFFRDIKVDKSVIASINGFLWWLSYLICRILYGVFIIYTAATELLLCDKIAPSSPNFASASGCSKVPYGTAVFFLVSIVALYSMSLLWFKKITQGMLKALGLAPSKGNKDGKNK